MPEFLRLEILRHREILRIEFHYEIEIQYVRTYVRTYGYRNDTYVRVRTSTNTYGTRGYEYVRACMNTRCDRTEKYSHNLKIIRNNYLRISLYKRIYV